MKVTFLGVGEAFDPVLSNTSLHVETGCVSLILDCGFSVGLAVWRFCDAPLEVDALYVTHYHGDHFLGIPAFLAASMEGGRSRPLTVYGQSGLEERVRKAVELAYPGVLNKLGFPIDYVECAPGDVRRLGDVRLSFARAEHGTPCLSLRVDDDRCSLFYSGDGGMNAATETLAQGCDLVILESYNLESTASGHGSIDDSVDFARRVNASRLACVHVNRRVRKQQFPEIEKRLMAGSASIACLPQPGDVIELSHDEYGDCPVL